MKKIYTKPVLVMESFTLSQSIADNCGKYLDFSQATLKYKGSCGWDLRYDEGQGSGQDILWMATPNCTLPTNEPVTDAGVCYNNPDGGFNIFNS